MWELARESPIVVMVMFWVACWAAVQPFKFAYKAYKYRLRAKNIAQHGWPIPPLDADGELRYPDTDELSTDRSTVGVTANR
jgi:hypothetical protein